MDNDRFSPKNHPILKGRKVFVEKTSGTSLTEPKAHMTIEQLWEKHKKGMLIPKQKIYSETIKAVEKANFDFADIDEAKKTINELISLDSMEKSNKNALEQLLQSINKNSKSEMATVPLNDESGKTEPNEANVNTYNNE